MDPFVRATDEGYKAAYKSGGGRTSDKTYRSELSFSPNQLLICKAQSKHESYS